ncbi:MAG: rod shape-determining protein [Clostridia bacterium]
MKIELAIKFGSNEIIVYRKGYGIVSRVSSYVALTKGGNSVAYGNKAKQLCASKPSQYTLIEPIQGINITDSKIATKLMKYIINDVVNENGHVSVIVAVPCALTENKLLEIKMLLHKAGVNKIIFVQNSVCVRTNLTYLSEDAKVMVVDMGKYLVDVSVLTKYEFIAGRDYIVGGAEMDNALATYIQDNYCVNIGPEDAETIKDEIASMYAQDMYTTTFTGIDDNSTYQDVTMRANEARVAIIGVYDKIFDLIDEFMETLPSEVLAEIRKNGIVFTGGVSSINGLVEYASKHFNMPTKVIGNPKDAVILGAGKLLSLDKNEYIHISL